MAKGYKTEHFDKVKKKTKNKKQISDGNKKTMKISDLFITCSLFTRLPK